MDSKLKIAVDEIETVVRELRTYNPAADTFNGVYIHKGWANRIERSIAAIGLIEPAQGPDSVDTPKEYDHWDIANGVVGELETRKYYAVEDVISWQNAKLAEAHSGQKVDERAAFEVWAKIEAPGHSLERDEISGAYLDYHTLCAYRGFKAGRAAIDSIEPDAGQVPFAYLCESKCFRLFLECEADTPGAFAAY